MDDSSEDAPGEEGEESQISELDPAVVPGSPTEDIADANGESGPGVQAPDDTDDSETGQEADVDAATSWLPAELRSLSSSSRSRTGTDHPPADSRVPTGVSPPAPGDTSQALGASAEAGPALIARVEALDQRVERLSEESDRIEATMLEIRAGQDTTVPREELDAVVRGISDRLDDVEKRQARIESIEDRLGELEARAAELDATAASREKGTLASLERLAKRIEEIPRDGAGALQQSRAELEALIGTAEATWSERIDEVESRRQATAAEQESKLEERIAKLQGSVERTHAELRKSGVESEARLEARIADVRESAERGLSEFVSATEAVDAKLIETIEARAAAVEKNRARLESEVEDLRARHEELGPVLKGAVEDLGEAGADLRRRVVEQEQELRRVTSEGSTERAKHSASVREGLLEVRSELGDRIKDLERGSAGTTEQLTEINGELQRIRGDQERSIREALREHSEGHRRELARLAGRLEESDVAGGQDAISELGRSIGGLEAQIESERTRTDDLHEELADRIGRALAMIEEVSVAMRDRYEAMEGSLADLLESRGDGAATDHGALEGSSTGGITYERLRELGLSVTQTARVLAALERGALSSAGDLDGVAGLPDAMRSKLAQALFSDG